MCYIDKPSQTSKYYQYHFRLGIDDCLRSYVYTIVGSRDLWADRRSLTFGLLLFLSWVPIYLFYTTSTHLLDDISRRETKYALDEHTLFYEAFDSLTPMVARAEIILNWFVLIKFTLIIIAVKGTIEPLVALAGWQLWRPRVWSTKKKDYLGWLLLSQPFSYQSLTFAIISMFMFQMGDIKPGLLFLAFYTRLCGHNFMIFKPFSQVFKFPT